MLIDYDKAVWAVAVQLAFEADMEYPGNHHPEDYLSTAKMYFNKIEAIEEPKTGRWKPCKASIHPYGNDVKCSECGYTMGSSFGFKYCPNCGARMESEK